MWSKESSVKTGMHKSVSQPLSGRRSSRVVHGRSGTHARINRAKPCAFLWGMKPPKEVNMRGERTVISKRKGPGGSPAAHVLRIYVLGFMELNNTKMTVNISVQVLWSINQKA